MAELVKDRCHNCGNTDCVLFCDNEFTDFLCKKCGATNLVVCLPRVEEVTPCKNSSRHDLRVSKQGLFCLKCYKLFDQNGKERKTKKEDLVDI